MIKQDLSWLPNQKNERKLGFKPFNPQMRDLSCVYHVGDMNEADPAVYRAAGRSFEGNGLSVSAHPNVWRKIAKLGGGTTYALKKENAKFLNAYDKALRLEALKWCIGAGFIHKKTLYRVLTTDEEGVSWFSDYVSREEALKEASEESEVKKTVGYIVSDEMLGYFADGMTPSIILTTDYAVIWYAEAAGFDGVWWEESLDPSSLSAPRGVIFQHKLDEWTIVRNLSEDEP
jgi:hypothetical protein